MQDAIFVCSFVWSPPVLVHELIVAASGQKNLDVLVCAIMCSYVKGGVAARIAHSNIVVFGLDVDAGWTCSND